MTAVLSFLVAILSLAICIHLISMIKKQQNKKSQLQGIEWLQQLANLLVLTQRHRGLTSGYLSGDSRLLANITDQQHKIGQQINTLLANGDWITNNERWHGVADHWKRLAENHLTADKEYSFTQHNVLIKNILYLIEDYAEHHHLQELNCDQQQPANILWQLILNAGENVGQARAIGTGIAATGVSSSVERIKLNFLQLQLQDFIAKNPIPSLNPPIESLLKSIKEHILISKPDLSAEQYFNLATQALDKLMEGFSERLRQLKQ